MFPPSSSQYFRLYFCFATRFWSTVILVFGGRGLTRSRGLTSSAPHFSSFAWCLSFPPLSRILKRWSFRELFRVKGYLQELKGQRNWGCDRVDGLIAVTEHRDRN